MPLRRHLAITVLSCVCALAADQPVQNPVDVAAKQSAAAASMQPSIEKQRTAVQSQVGSGGPADAFFTTPWTTPASIPLPNIIPACDPMSEDELKPLVENAAKAQALKPELIRAVIRRESASYACAVSERGALGLMQLMPEVAQQFGVDPLDPKQNVNAGAQYLKQLMIRYNGDLKLTLAAYNAGPQRIDADKKVPDIPETTAYVDAILKDLNSNSAQPK
jgi:soluble lytic murein transglycosylase-like protein